MASVRTFFLLFFLKATDSGDVRLGVLLPKYGVLPFSLQKTLPGIEIALESMNENRFLLPSHKLSVIVRDSKCSASEAPLQAVELYSVGHVHGFIGPACEYAVAPVARYSPRWGIPVLTGGAMVGAFQDKTEYKLLTRLMGSYNQLGEFFISLTKRFNWKHVGFIYSDYKNQSNKGRSNCFFMMEALYLAAKKEKLNSWHVSFDANAENFDVDNILDQAKTKARVLLMCAGPDHVRKIMIRAHDRLVKDDFVFFNVAPFESDPQSKQWYRQDESTANNTKARSAYEGLMTITLRKPTSREYKEFSKEVNRRAAVQYMNYTSDGEVNSFVGAFHDAIILYALALHETIEAGGNITDGEAITKRMWNRTFEGITGTVSIDSNGDREMDFSLLDLNPATGGFEVVGNYFGRQKIYTPIEGKNIHWPGGRTEPPPDIPPCGFEGEKCPSGGSETLEITESSILNVLSRGSHKPEDLTAAPTEPSDRIFNEEDVTDILEPSFTSENWATKRKLTSDDVTQLQYEVLLEEKKKVIAETSYYKLMNRKLMKELDV